MSANNGGGQFDALLEDIGVLAKSAAGEGDGDAKIAAAAAEGAEAGEDADKDKDKEAGEETLGKSFMVKLEDGTEVPAVDASDLIKSLIDRVEVNEDKAIQAITGLLGVVKLQDGLIKSMQDQITAFGGAGKGRKAVLAITEKPGPKAEDLAKSEPGGASGGMSGEEFMAKAMDAQASGRIRGSQVAEAESHINMGLQPPAHIIRAVLAQ